MSDPVILFVKPNAISPRDKKALSTAGVIVVEVDDPQAVKLVRASVELDGGALLRAAAQAMTHVRAGAYASDVREAFAKAICAALDVPTSGQTP